MGEEQSAGIKPKEQAIHLVIKAQDGTEVSGMQLLLPAHGPLHLLHTGHVWLQHLTQC